MIFSTFPHPSFVHPGIRAQERLLASGDNSQAPIWLDSDLGPTKMKASYSCILGFISTERKIIFYTYIYILYTCYLYFEWIDLGKSPWVGESWIRMNPTPLKGAFWREKKKRRPNGPLLVIRAVGMLVGGKVENGVCFVPFFPCLWGWSQIVFESSEFTDTLSEI